MFRPILRVVCLFSGMLSASHALAVWPPSTSLVTENPMAPSQEPGEIPREVSQEKRLALEKLEADEERLQQILQDIRRDEEALKKTQQKQTSTP